MVSGEMFFYFIYIFFSDLFIYLFKASPLPTVGLELMTPNQESDAPLTEPAWCPQNVFILKRKNQVIQWLHSFLSELGDMLTAPSLAQTELEQQPPQTPLPDRLDIGAHRLVV